MDATETYICHQCNCLTNRSKHLASTVFKKFPYADVYTKRQEPSLPGTIEIRGDKTKDQRSVIAMFAQYYPGKAKYPTSKKDGTQARLDYFKSCLEKMKNLKGSFAFPAGIGCGAAGGDWENYYATIISFSEKYSKKVTIYSLAPLKQPESPKLF